MPEPSARLVPLSTAGGEQGTHRVSGTVHPTQELSNRFLGGLPWGVSLSGGVLITDLAFLGALFRTSALNANMGWVNRALLRGCFKSKLG